MDIDNIIERLKNVKKNYELAYEQTDGGFMNEAEEEITSVIKDLEKMVDDGK